MKAKAILFNGVNEVSVDQITVPDPERGEVLIETYYSCISPGTELRCLAGQEPGAAPWPVIPGYALTGRVIARGPGATLPLGTAVFCTGTTRSDRNHLWGGHVSHAVAPEGQVFSLPESVGLREASTAHMAAIAFHGMQLSRPSPTDKVAVVGLGPIGYLSAHLHTLTGAHVVATDVSDDRVALARRSGVEALNVGSSLAETFQSVFPEGADVVVDATGAAPVLPQAIEIVRNVTGDDGLRTPTRFVVQGSYPGDLVLPYPLAFRRELTFLVPCDMQPRDLRAVLDLMRRGKLVVGDLVSKVCAPEEAAGAYAALQQPGGALLATVFQWKEGA